MNIEHRIGKGRSVERGAWSGKSGNWEEPKRRGARGKDVDGYRLTVLEPRGRESVRAEEGVK